jgi:hypothetical protein
MTFESIKIKKGTAPEIVALIAEYHELLQIYRDANRAAFERAPQLVNLDEEARRRTRAELINDDMRCAGTEAKLTALLQEIERRQLDGGLQKEITKPKAWTPPPPPVPVAQTIQDLKIKIAEGERKLDRRTPLEEYEDDEEYPDTDPLEAQIEEWQDELDGLLEDEAQAKEIAARLPKTKNSTPST